MIEIVKGKEKNRANVNFLVIILSFFSCIKLLLCFWIKKTDHIKVRIHKI